MPGLRQHSKTHSARETKHNMDKLVPCPFHKRYWKEQLGPQLPLHYCAYDVHDLIDRTIKYSLTPLDLNRAVDAAEELRDYLAYRQWTEYDIKNPEHYPILCRCAVLIDETFFAGQLTQASRYSKHDGMWHLKIHIVDRGTHCKQPWSTDYSIDFDTGGADLPPCVRIDLATGKWYSIYKLVGHLIHEMAHGYLDLFTCPGICFRRPYCHSRCYDTKGRHGGHVTSLLKSIFGRINRWHVALSVFGYEEILYCNPRVTAQ